MTLYHADPEVGDIGSNPIALTFFWDVSIMDGMRGLEPCGVSLSLAHPTICLYSLLVRILACQASGVGSIPAAGVIAKCKVACLPRGGGINSRS